MCTVPVKTLLFKTYCSGLYCSGLWGQYRSKTFRKLKLAYNSVYRKLMGLSKTDSISHSMIAHGIDPFPVIHRKFTFSLLKRLSDSENPVLNVLCSWVGYFNSSMYKAWSNTLFLGDKTNTNFGN